MHPKEATFRTIFNIRRHWHKPVQIHRKRYEKYCPQIGSA